MNERNSLVYLDHAATSWPKPPQVTAAVTEAMLHDAANPGRGSHAMAVRASRILFDARKQLAKLFNVRNPNDIAFAPNTTLALNTAIQGSLKTGDHVIATTVEHNSVRRPLHYLEQTRGIEVTYIEGNTAGEIEASQIDAAVRSNTALIAVNHSSNLMGTILPIAEIGAIAKKHGVKLLVDAAQSAGVVPIDVEAYGIHMLAFPGHKGLLGPQGTGGLYIDPALDLEPLLYGGTGSQSEMAGQPLVRPDRYEAGTQNTPGIAGLREGVKMVLAETVEKIYDREWGLTQRLVEGLLSVPGLSLLGPEVGKPRTGIAAFRLRDVDPSELSFILDQHYGIAVRAGYHCTPLAHETAGTSATGAVRASVGFYTTERETDALVQAVKEIALQYKGQR